MTKEYLHRIITDLYNQSYQIANQERVKLSDLTRLSTTADEVQHLAELILSAAFKTRSKTL